MTIEDKYIIYLSNYPHFSGLTLGDWLINDGFGWLIPLVGPYCEWPKRELKSVDKHN